MKTATGNPVKSLSITRYFEEIKPKESGEYLRPVRVEGTTEFVRCDGKNYLMETEPFPQDIRFVVTAPGYQPQEFVISTHNPSPPPGPAAQWSPIKFPISSLPELHAADDIVTAAADFQLPSRKP